MDEGTASGRRRRRGPIELVGLLLAAVLVITVLPEPVDAAAPPLPVAQSSTSSAGSCQANGTSYTQMLADRRGFYSLPPWADGAGWANPGSYRTITSGDVDGDGNGELLGRSSSTIEVYTWAPALPAPAIGTSAYSPVPAQWTKVIPTGGSPVDFGDLTGWWDPSRYRTIQLGRLTGRSGTAGPAMDLVYRTATGLEVRTWSSSSSSWNDPITQNLNGGGQVWSDANAMGRSYPQRYLTITTGDVTGDQTDEIIGVGPSGTVEVWGYDGSGLRRLDNGTGPLGPGGWDPATWGASTYRTMRGADIDGVTGDEHVARDRNRGLRDFSITGGDWTEVPGQGTNNRKEKEGGGKEGVSSAAEGQVGRGAFRETSFRCSSGPRVPMMVRDNGRIRGARSAAAVRQVPARLPARRDGRDLDAGADTCRHLVPDPRPGRRGDGISVDDLRR